MDRNLDLRRGGYDRWLVPTEYTLDEVSLAKAGVRGRVFWHEILWMPMGTVDAYLEALRDRFLPAAKRLGAQLVGAYRVALRPRQALVLLAFREWADLARLLEAQETDSELRDWFPRARRAPAGLRELILLPSRMGPRHPRLTPQQKSLSLVFLSETFDSQTAFDKSTGFSRRSESKAAAGPRRKRKSR